MSDREHNRPPPPHRALWEITRRCHLRCRHCLVEGGAPARDELTTSEALALVDDLAALGVAVVSLTGGEPLLRPDWAEIAASVRARGMGLRFSATGHGMTAATVARLEELGTESFAVSVDGLEATHDQLRRRPRERGQRLSSPFAEAMEALDRLRRSSIVSAAITTVTRGNLGEFEAIHRLLVERDVRQWMVQLAHRSGRLRRGGPDAVAPIEPADLPGLARFLVRVGRERRLRLIVHNTIGYLASTEPLLRRSGAAGRRGFWQGCGCGKSSIGLAPNGDVKGCANQVGPPFIVGNVRRETLETIWCDRRRWHWLDPAPEDMRGRCADCELRRACGGGCTALAFSATGELFNNPYCLRTIS